MHRSIHSFSNLDNQSRPHETFVRSLLRLDSLFDKGSTPTPSMTSDGGPTNFPPGEASNVIVSTDDGGDGLADWATVLISFVGLCVTVFVAWYGIRRQTSSPAVTEL